MTTVSTNYIIYYCILTATNRKSGDYLSWKVLHSSSTDYSRVSEPKITYADNSVTSLTFKVMSNSSSVFPGSDYARRMVVKVTKYVTGKTITRKNRFIGVVTKAVDYMAEDGEFYCEYTCESPFGLLNDVTIPGNTLRVTSKNVLDALVTSLSFARSMRIRGGDYFFPIYHGAVDDDLAAMSYSDDNVDGDRYTVMEVVQDCIVGNISAYATLREGTSDDLARLRDYYENASWNPQYTPWFVLDVTRDPGNSVDGLTIALGENMISCSRETGQADIITVMQPLGAEYTDASGNRQRYKPDHGTVILADGTTSTTDALATTFSGFVVDKAALEKYGLVMGDHDFKWCELTDTLIERGVAWLKENNSVHANVTVSAYDLSTLGLADAAFDINDVVEVTNSKLGLDESMRVVKMVEDIESPMDTTFEFGRAASTISGR